MGKRVYLEEIVLQKRERIEQRREELQGIKERVISGEFVKNRPSFYQALAKDGLSIIGEVKKASPSKGLIKADFKPLEIAESYETCVEAISVLTEENYFLGSDHYLREISQKVGLPTLCKDFIIDPLQIYNAKSLGASAILLIVAILTDDEIDEMMNLAKSLGLDVLVEVHTEEEMLRALELDVQIIGINNRNLKTFETDLQVTIDLRKLITNEDILVISESGIFDVTDIVRLKEARIDGILVGESFMKAPDIVKHAEDFKDAYQN